MALRVAGTTSHVAGTGFNAGFASDARGHSVFAWLRRNGSETPRVGLFGASNSRSNVGLNGASPRGVLTDTAAVNLLPSGGSFGIGVWVPVALSVKDLGGTRRAALCFAPSGTLGTASSTSFAMSAVALNAIGIGREVSAGTAFIGDYAHAAVWDAALEDGELQALCGGANPLTIRRGALQAYFPLDGDLRNLANPAFRLTANSDLPVWVDGPGLVRPPPAPLRVALLRPATVVTPEPPVAGPGEIITTRRRRR